MIRSTNQNELVFMTDAGDEIARITEKLEKHIAVLTLSGTLNTELSFDLGDELKALLMTGCHVTLDMQAVTHLSAPIGSVLLNSQNDAEHYGKRLLLRHVPACVMETLKANNLRYSLDIEEEG